MSSEPDQESGRSLQPPKTTLRELYKQAAEIAKELNKGRNALKPHLRSKKIRKGHVLEEIARKHGYAGFLYMKNALKARDEEQKPSDPSGVL